MKSVYKELGQVDILAFGVHPDDLELSCAGTILKHKSLGCKIGIVDLTQGELGSRGSAKVRLKESRIAAEILDVDFRVNLEMFDGSFVVDQRHIHRIAKVIRITKPKIILANAIEDRHPDHGRAARLVAESFFYSGLRKITIDSTEAYRADVLYHYIQDKNLMPDFCVDVSEHVEQKFQSIYAYSTQFNVQEGDGPQTPISSETFMDFIDAKMRVLGRSINVTHAEGFNINRTLGVGDLRSLI